MDFNSTFFLESLPRPLQFPTSSAREAPYNPAEQRYDPLGILKQTYHTTATTNYTTSVQRPSIVAPGVLSDGSITIGHPQLRHFLESAESNPRVAPPTSPTIFALAALVVFYHPNRPAHWIFWSKEKRENTANIVQKVLDAKPVLIKSPMAWIGIPESLWVLCNLQFGWREQLAKTSWYSYFVEAAAGKPRMNLRKRKAPPELPPTDNTDGAGEGPSPAPRKRPRTRRIGPSARAVLPQPALCTQTQTDETPASKACIPLPSTPPPAAPALATSSASEHAPSTEASGARAENPSQPRTSMRQKARRARDTAGPVPGAMGCARERSPSASGCSSSTAVSASVSVGRGRSTSMSDLSVATAVEVETVGRGKVGAQKEGDGACGGVVEDLKGGTKGGETTPVAPRTRASTRTKVAKDTKTTAVADTSSAKPIPVAPAPTNVNKEQVADGGRGAILGEKAKSADAKPRARARQRRPRA